MSLPRLKQPAFQAASSALGIENQVNLSPDVNLQDVKAEHYKEVGNDMLRLHLYPQAVQAYQMAITTKPIYTDAYYNLAQTFKILGQIPQAIATMTSMLFINPNDHDGRVTLGEYYERIGDTQSAKRLYMQVLMSKPNFDPAKRNLSYLIHMDQLKSYPETASEIIKTAQKEVIFKARALLKNYYSSFSIDPELAKLSQSIPIVFSTTQVVENTENIAEYDHSKRAIRLQSKMMFSSPNVIAAYLAHELVHAKDNDAETSIMEEQDGYRALAKFWNVFKNTEVETNLDRALKLHTESQARLDHEVRHLYTMRNPVIAEHSPGHGQPLKASQPQVNKSEAVEERAKQFNRERVKRLLGFYQGGF